MKFFRGRPTESDERPWRVYVRLLPPVHAFWYATRWVGLRDRLRCPSCEKVGTWKPHGTYSARWVHGDRAARRWLCKFCGYYNGPEGIVQAFPDRDRGVWSLPRPLDPDAPVDTDAHATPKALAKAARMSNPWGG